MCMCVRQAEADAWLIEKLTAQTSDLVDVWWERDEQVLLAELTRSTSAVKQGTTLEDANTQLEDRTPVLTHGET